MLSTGVKKTVNRSLINDKFQNPIGDLKVKIQFLRTSVFILTVAVLVTTGIARDRDAVRFGGDIVIQENETVNSAVVIGGTVTVYGTVKNEAVAVGGSIHVKDGGRINNDAVAIGGKVRIEDGGIVGGNIIDVGNLIAMATSDHDDHSFRDYHHHDIPTGVKLLPFIGMLILGLLAVTFFKGTVQSTVTTIEARTLPAFGVGILGMIAFIPVILTLLISLLGIPLIPLFVALTILTILVGYIGASTWVGVKLLDALKQEGKSLLVAFIVGLIAIKIIDYVPFIGGLVVFVALILGFGAVLLNLRKRFSKNKDPKLPVQEKAE